MKSSELEPGRNQHFCQGATSKSLIEKEGMATQTSAHLNFLGTDLAKRNPLFEASTSYWGSVDWVGSCDFRNMVVFQWSIKNPVLFISCLHRGNFWNPLGDFFPPAQLFLQDLSQKIDDAIKSISDECYLQLDLWDFRHSNFVEFHILAVVIETSLSLIEKNGKFLSKKNAIKRKNGRKTGAISGFGSLRVHPSVDQCY